MNKVRLPHYIKPERYELTVKPDLEGFLFEGEEGIELHLEKSVSEITLHAKELKISDVSYLSGGLRVTSNKLKYNTKAETATITFSKKLPKGKGKLSLKFKGVLNNYMRGFYRSRYIHDGKEKHLATTQFEATDARRAFPCFDEPAQKAVFDVTIMVPPGLTAISNTIESSIKEHDGGYKAVQFAPTPKMSTYLLAFIVGDFEFIEGATKRGVKVRVFVTPGKKHQAKFALDTAIKILDFYEKYFAINYPLPILDLIAIPDFSHGAMENWGAVTYRESALLVDPEHSSASNKQWVALVIAHELAHQWFGNLVTMHWWTDLWLNEGFASYIEYLAVNELFPHWDIWTQFAYADLGVALRLDGLKNTHPIEVEVGHPDEIGEIFDEVSYSKGASVIRMLANYLGEKNFRDGLRHYLKKHAYQNTKTVDLWNAFEKISKKPVAKIMETWTKMPGYPVLKVVQKPKGLEITQTRYFSSALSKKDSIDKTVWQIPIKIESGKLSSSAKTTADLRKVESLMSEKSMNLIINTSQSIKINSGETGFYRVDYPAQMLNQLHSTIKNKSLPAIDRLGIIRDAFATAEAQELPTSQALELTLAYVNETDYTVWTEISAGLNLVHQLIFNQPFEKKYKNFAKNIFKKEVIRLGFKPHKNETHTQGLLRSLVLSNYASFGGQDVIKKAKDIFKSGKVAADLRGMVYRVVAENGGEKEYKKFVNSYKNETLNEEKNRLGRALANFLDTKLLEKTLNFAMSKEVRLQDAPMIIAGVIANPYGRTLAWKYVQKNWKELNKRYPSSGHMLGRMLKPLSLMNTEKEFKELKGFFKKHPAKGMQRTVEQILERVESNILWLENQKNKIEEYLNAI